MDNYGSMAPPEPTTPRRGPGRPRAEHAGDSRSLLLAVARRQFAALGYTATTTRGISEAAGMQAANLRHHLGSKPEVFAAVYDDCLARVGLLLTEMIEFDGAPTPGGYVRRLGRLVVDAPDVMAFLAIAPVERRRHPELQGTVGAGPAGLEDLVRTTVAAWGDEGRVADGIDPHSLADVLIAISYGTVAGAVEQLPRPVELGGEYDEPGDRDDDPRAGEHEHHETRTHQRESDERDHDPLHGRPHGAAVRRRGRCGLVVVGGGRRCVHRELRRRWSFAGR